MVSFTFIQNVNDVIGQGLPRRRVEVKALPATILQWTEGPGWEVYSEIVPSSATGAREHQLARDVGENLTLGPNQVLVFTTPTAIMTDIGNLKRPPGLGSATTIATLLLLDDEAAEEVASVLLASDKLGREVDLKNVTQGVRAIGEIFENL